MEGDRFMIRSRQPLRAGSALIVLAISACLPDLASAQSNPPPLILRRLPPAVTTPAPTPQVQVRPVVLSTRIQTLPLDIQPASPLRRIEKGKQVKPRAAPVMLRANAFTGMTIVRQYQAPALRLNPTLTLGRGKVSLKPLFDNPKALPNIAQTLRSMPQIADVADDDIQVMEIPQGLVLRSTMAYRIKPGVCGDAIQRRSLPRVGIACPVRQTDATRAAAYANPADPHYVADPSRRAAAIADASGKAAADRTGALGDIGQFRAMLANPAQRSQMEAEIGAGEVARLAGLSDDALLDEMVANAETTVDQVMFVPTTDKVDVAADEKIAKGAVPVNMLGGLKVAPSNGMNPATINAIAQAMDREEKTYPINPHVFLTGFTLGRDYEWRQRVETTVKWCLVGCKKTYYAEVYAGFNYGFGLRFPIRLAGEYKYMKVGDSATATVRPTFAPINGTESDYRDTGLPDYQLFEGKELVAQFDAYAGAAYKVPVLGSGGIRFDVGMDFTDDLPAPFTNGQFAPPAPGNPISFPKVFDQFDLIGGQANFGVAGAQVFPAIKVDLVSNALEFTLHDEVANVDKPVSYSGQPVKLGIEPSTQLSKFTIGNPKYNLAFEVTPGLDARLFIDVSVWSHTWDWPVWFPQLTVQLPPGGVDFGCHDNTQCSRKYRYGPKGFTEGEGSPLGMLTDLDAWADGFEARHLGDCVDETCKAGVRLVKLGTVLHGKHLWDATPDTARKALSLDTPDMKAALAEAEGQASGLKAEAQQRQTNKAADSFHILIEAVWSKQCSDKTCFDKVKAITALEAAEMKARQKTNPDKSTTEIIGEVGKIYSPILQKEIDASKARAAAEANADALRAARAASRPMLTPGALRLPVQPRPGN